MKNELMKFRFALLTCLCLSACIGTPYQKPPTPAPQVWSNSTAVSQAWPDKNWWKQFNSPELSALITEARTNNFDIKAAMARIQQANAQLQIAGASLFPAVDLNASAQRSQTGKNSRTNNSTDTKTFVGNSFSVAPVASYELDLWGKNRSTVAADQALANASKFDKAAIDLTTTASVANTYFDLLATQERVMIAQNNLAAAQRLLQSYQHRQTEGVASDLDVAQEENLVAMQGAAIPPLVLRAQQDKNALAVLVGRLPEALNIPSPQVDMANMAVPNVVPGLPSELLTRRPDVAEAEANLIAAHENINAARAALFPDIMLTVEGGYASTVLSSLFKPGGEFFTLGGDLTQPIFHAGALTGAIQLEKGLYDEQLQNYGKAVISAFADTENSLATNTQNAEQLKDDTNVVVTAQHAYDLSLQQFQAGIVDITTVLNTQRSLFSAQDTLAQTQLARLQAVISLYTSLGGGWKQN